MRYLVVTKVNTKNKIVTFGYGGTMKQNLIEKVGRIFGFRTEEVYKDIFFIGGSKEKRVEVTKDEIRIDAIVTLKQLKKIKEVLES